MHSIDFLDVQTTDTNKRIMNGYAEQTDKNSPKRRNVGAYKRY